MFHLSFLVAALAAGSPIYGVARAGDGDSLSISSERVRLFGIDAPEFNQTCNRLSGAWACGREAANQLSRLVTGRDLRCDPLGRDQYDRVLARCYLAGADINFAMVASGYATAYRRYSLDYVSAENAARASKRGIWAGTFLSPAEYRHDIRENRRNPRKNLEGAQASRKPASGPPGCLIKGNHSRRGEWIYHLPGTPYYSQIRPEAIFCNEAQALASGYRKARVH